MTDLHLVGSVPLETAQEVFERFGKPLGSHLELAPQELVASGTHIVKAAHRES